MMFWGDTIQLKFGELFFEVNADIFLLRSRFKFVYTMLWKLHTHITFKCCHELRSGESTKKKLNWLFNIIRKCILNWIFSNLILHWPLRLLYEPNWPFHRVIHVSSSLNANMFTYNILRIVGIFYIYTI